jgi:hypothetical protein
MKTTRPPRETYGASKQGEKAKPHASWPSSNKGQSSTAKIQPKLPNK